MTAGNLPLLDRLDRGDAERRGHADDDVAHLHLLGPEHLGALHGAHGEPLGDDEIAKTKAAYGWPADAGPRSAQGREGSGRMAIVRYIVAAVLQRPLARRSASSAPVVLTGA